MNNITLFNLFSNACSRSITRQYSTSFYSAIKLLSPEIRIPICGIYGMVRLADEIVDTFHDFDKATLLAQFKEDTMNAVTRKISLNPVLQCFQQTVNRYGIEESLIVAFFESMETDLFKCKYADREEFQRYIYGSAEVVGLMCLRVFCDGDKMQYDELKPYAMALGAAFQKVNFLRDLGADVSELRREYFPGFDKANFDRVFKEKIEREIAEDFELAYQGIKKLPVNARFGVYVAYRYYMALFRKARRSNAEIVLNQRIRIPNYTKAIIVLKAGLRSRLNMI